MGKYGSKKSRVLESTTPDKSKNKSKPSKTKKFQISSEFSELFNLFDENKLKIIISISAIIFVFIFFKTCGQSCKSNSDKNFENKKSNEIIDSIIDEKQEKIESKNKKIIYRKKSKKNLDTKPKTYSKPVNEGVVKKKKIEDPNFGTTIDIVDPDQK